MINFTIDNNEKSIFPHYWEKCVGSSHAYTTLRDDYRKQLKMAHEELGFQYVRFHGLFNDQMSVCSQPLSFDTPMSQRIIYNFMNIDNIFDFLLSIDMKPFIELGSMPGCLASGDDTIFNYGMNITPPANYKKWNHFINAFIEHLDKRYGKKEIHNWFFEVWNEPNMPTFWTGTKDEYFELYENTVSTIKSYDCKLKVGGPSTACNAWITDFIRFCEEKNIPLDFITTHHYPSDEQLWKKGDFTFDDVMKIYLSGEKRKFERDIMMKMTSKTREQAGKYPLYYTEWNPSGEHGDAKHDENYSATMVAKVLSDNDGLVDGYSFWTISDIFEECGQLSGVFHGGFGLMNYYGIPKPVYRCLQLFHGAGNERYGVTSDCTNGTVEMIALNIPKGIRLITYNYNTPDAPLQDEMIHINLPEVFQNGKITIQKIDKDHTNPKQAWIDIGSPEYLKAEHIQYLQKESELKREILNTLDLLIPAHGMCAIDIETK